MACEIAFGDRWVALNNMQFSRLIDFGIEIAERIVSAEDAHHLARMKTLRHECFWPGRGIQVEDDFPDQTERKFWAKVFFETARAIFNREVGMHDHVFWQPQAIHQAYATGSLFEHAVRQSEPRWTADTVDRREFDRIVNGIER